MQKTAADLPVMLGVPIGRSMRRLRTYTRSEPRPPLALEEQERARANSIPGRGVRVAFAGSACRTCLDLGRIAAVLAQEVEQPSRRFSFAGNAPSPAYMRWNRNVYQPWRCPDSSIHALVRFIWRFGNFRRREPDQAVDQASFARAQHALRRRGEVERPSSENTRRTHVRRSL
jgi:hypothetical protein